MSPGGGAGPSRASPPRAAARSGAPGRGLVLAAGVGTVMAGIVRVVR